MVYKLPYGDKIWDKEIYRILLQTSGASASAMLTRGLYDPMYPQGPPTNSSGPCCLLLTEDSCKIHVVVSTDGTIDYNPITEAPKREDPDNV